MARQSVDEDTPAADVELMCTCMDAEVDTYTYGYAHAYMYVYASRAVRERA
jgi:hypothetical protein